MMKKNVFFLTGAMLVCCTVGARAFVSKPSYCTSVADSLSSDTTEEKKDIRLKGAGVVARRKRNTEAAVMSEQRKSLVVQNAVSAQQIAKTQDKDAGEVMRRVPGVSLIDEKFVMVRGLSQRYNNVWMNGGAVPSSEADARAFSFDIIPSAQIDNMTIVKSPAPEYPADFTGGFVLINTKDMPSEGGLNISVGTGINDRTHFRRFLEQKGNHTSYSNLDKLTRFSGSENYDIANSGMNNNWGIKKINPLPDIKVGASYAHTFNINAGRLGVITALGYGRTSKSYTDMENSLFGSYDTTNDKPVYLRESTDDRFSTDQRLSALLNLSFRPKSGIGTFEWKNIINNLQKESYTERKGYNAQNDQEHNFEYYESSRTTYNTQLTGKHTFGNTKADWSAGYAFANRLLPDRRVIELNDRTENRMGLYSVDREWTKLNEHIFSIATNLQRQFNVGKISPTVKAGLYGQYITRKYDTRSLYYSWNPTTSTLPENFQFSEDVGSLLAPENYGQTKLYMKEDVNFTNNYEGRNTQGAGYIGVNIPISKFNIYGGVRYEYSRMELITNTRQTEESHISTYYDYSDIFPSLNMGYKLTPKQQLRAAYGRSINRPEFRELSPVVYYDFDLASNVQGNAQLKAAYISNFDLRYEFYPSAGELVSVALFYKHFSNPIEWTYTVNGGTDLTYSNKNAKAANNYGVEIEIRKNLDFIGLKEFSLSFNGALIHSSVEFETGSNEQNRAMQGQSPYLINMGLFYQNSKSDISASLLYNCIGKRLVGVGRSLGSTGSEDAKNIPNSYEMPRHSIDLNLGKKLKKWELKLAVRDVLAQSVKFQQIETVTTANGSKEIEEVTKSYKPGRSFSLTATYNF